MKYRHDQAPRQHQYIRLMFWTVVFTLDALLVYTLLTNDYGFWLELLMW